MKTFTHSILALVACASLMIGCSSPSSPSSSYAYHAGSTFIFKEYEIDSLGNYGPPKIAVDSVEAVGLSIGGWTNVSRIIEKAIGDTNTFMFYLAYRSNGDFAIGDSGFSSSAQIDWSILPTGSRKTIVVSDTMLSSTEREYESISYIGQESITTPAGTFNSIKIEDKFTVTDTSSYPYSYINTDDIWYVPQLGMFVKIQGHISDTTTYTIGYTTTTESGNLMLLDSYK